MRPDEYTVIDIETYPDIDMIGKLPEIPFEEAKTGNLKDPDKIAAKEAEALSKHEEKKMAQVAEMALNPLYGKIACVGYQMGTGDSTINNKGCAIDQDEEKVIRTFFDKIIPFGQTGSPKIVTWNGMGFDIPFIYKRAMILGVKPTVSMGYFMKRYQTDTHCDLMQVWCNWYGREKLDNVAKALLGEGKQDFDFRTIKDLIKVSEGREKIAEYCSKDVEITSKLFYKMANILF